MRPSQSANDRRVRHRGDTAKSQGRTTSCFGPLTPCGRDRPTPTSMNSVAGLEPGDVWSVQKLLKRDDPSRFRLLAAHDLLRKPLHTFRDHARGGLVRLQAERESDRKRAGED